MLLTSQMLPRPLTHLSFSLLLIAHHSTSILSPPGPTLGTSFLWPSLPAFWQATKVWNLGATLEAQLVDGKECSS